jgi:multicomponent Na+:H+ antiporter subunit C
VLFFVSIDFDQNTTSPIASVDPAIAANPLPQALMITVIVIGISVTAVALTMFINLYHKYGTTNWSKVVTKMREEL